MQHEEKQQYTFAYTETKVTVPPPAYNVHQAPPPRYESHGVVMMTPNMTNTLEEEDSWSVVMNQSFYKRWSYLFGSWCHVFQQGRWVLYAYLSCFTLLVTILVTVWVFILPSYNASL